MKTACNVEKQRLMNAIYQCGFAISDITILLETKFGPLTQTGEQRQNYWQWTVSPWPWERGYY